MGAPFDDASAGTLRRLAEAFRSGQLGPDASRFSISQVASCSESVAGEVMRLVGEGMAPAHLGLLLDISAECAEVRGSHVRADLVWTGPETSTAHSRDTAVVLKELFDQAKEDVLVSTFVVRQPGIVFRSLADRMAAVPDLRVRIFLHIGRELRDTVTDSELLREFADKLGADWPGPRRPTVYYDPRGLLVDSAQQATWHAKCAVIDRDLSFVTSANFTEWAHHRNVEAGVLIRSQHFAAQLSQQFETLVQAKLVRQLPGF